MRQKLDGSFDLSTRGNDEVDNAYDYHLHLNNYLPTYNVSETDQSDEQTPMLAHRSVNNRNNKNNLDTSSEMNCSIAALPEDASSVVVAASAASNGHGNGDNLCELEDSDEDEVTLGGGAANNGNKRNSVNPRVTSV